MVAEGPGAVGFRHVSAPPLPIIIQGGMGAGVSDWRLASAVAMTGQLGVVSGTGIDTILTRRLQLGDPGGHMRRALMAFPIGDIGERIVDRYYVEGGKASDKRFKAKPMPSEDPSRHAEELLVAANFVEVWLAKEGHDSPVGINFLEKIQAPHLPSFYGAMLADVDYVLMGAGIPRAIPGILDDFAAGKSSEMTLDSKGASRDERFVSTFDPAVFVGCEPPTVRRPAFLAIVASNVLATMLARKASGSVEGFVVEGPTAGGHNAPPRGKAEFNPHGEPVYGERDVVDLDALAELGLPFWLAGSYGEPHRVAEALAAGAAGVQVGTAFAYCEESGFDAAIKGQVLKQSKAGTAAIFTDPVASPTGFPFKTVQLEGTLTDPKLASERKRVCDLGYLRTGYRRDDGTVGWRCPAEPVDDFVRKGGTEKDAAGRKCLCNALMSNIGLGQARPAGREELPLVTSGDDVKNVARWLEPGAESYSAASVIAKLLSEVGPELAKRSAASAVA
jgi:nitronate monooxygenase